MEASLGVLLQAWQGRALPSFWEGQLGLPLSAETDQRDLQECYCLAALDLLLAAPVPGALLLAPPQAVHAAVLACLLAGGARKNSDLS